ncbi:hypothetical protein [Paenibacillus lactis]|uniref:Uncharacterized protein n=1 Tax=Paenibacillus lactis 154 TaxID=743719 RepID=G4HNT0_9BACL|nr:hypothetical protein [Paenibacillus lactis]EHB50094.1 hypothetical protein PaelaDRAFT_5641 [Paenibacillus lactis 154]
MSRWSHWHVYEYIRQRFIHTGQVPDQQELLAEFSEMDPAVIEEGVKEFNLVMSIGGGAIAK